MQTRNHGRISDRSLRFLRCRDGIKNAVYYVEVGIPWHCAQFPKTRFQRRQQFRADRVGLRKPAPFANNSFVDRGFPGDILCRVFVAKEAVGGDNPILRVQRAVPAWNVRARIVGHRARPNAVGEGGNCFYGHRPFPFCFLSGADQNKSAVGIVPSRHNGDALAVYDIKQAFIKSRIGAFFGVGVDHAASVKRGDEPNSATIKIPFNLCDDSIKVAVRIGAGETVALQGKAETVTRDCVLHLRYSVVCFRYPNLVHRVYLVNPSMRVLFAMPVCV